MSNRFLENYLGLLLPGIVIAIINSKYRITREAKGLKNAAAERFFFD